MEDMVFCAKTDRQIIDGNVISLRRAADVLRPVLVDDDETAKSAPIEASPVPVNDDI